MPAKPSGRALDDVDGEVLLLVPLGGVGLEFVGSETLGGFLDGELVGGEGEIHASVSLPLFGNRNRESESAGASFALPSLDSLNESTMHHGDTSDRRDDRIAFGRLQITQLSCKLDQRFQFSRRTL